MTKTGKFISALQTRDTFTENGMVTHSTSGRKIVDLFFKMGGSRALSDASLESLFAAAFGEDALLATKAAFYNRDIRGGQGERKSFRVFFKYLCEHEPAVAIHNIPNVVHFGRWDDLLVALDTPVEVAAVQYIAQALVDGNKLAGKWMPREGKKDHEVADRLRKHMGLSWREYRALLAGNTDVVESKMCAQKWDAINYSHVPSVAVKKYRKSFYKRDGERYGAWVAELTKPVEERAKGVKVNAKAIFPHDIIKPFLDAGVHYPSYGLYARRYGNAMNITEQKALEAQWKALPDYMPKGRRILPICDVSGSMVGQPLEVSVALGLYMAERNVGPFENAIITFSEKPTVLTLTAKDLANRVAEVAKAPWGMNTNFEAVFKLVLTKAKAAGLAAADMPEAILVLSDMQFDSCVQKPSDTALSMIDRMYEEAGYKRPDVIFWNLRTSSGVPVKFDTQGTALVSGFSPSILKSIFSGANMTPMEILLQTLESERYERVTLPS